MGRGGALTAHLAELGPAYAAGERSGEIASTLVDGLDAIEAWTRSFRPAAVLAVVVPLLVLGVVLVLDPPSALVLLVTGPVLVALLGLIGSRVGPATAARAAELRWMQGYFGDMLRGLETLRAYGRSREQAGRIREIGLRYGDATMAVLRTAFQASLVLELGAAVAMALIAVELSLRLMTGGIGFETTLAVLVIAPEFFLPLRRLAAAYHEGAAGREAAVRVLEILDTPGPRRARSRRGRCGPQRRARARGATSCSTASPSPTPGGPNRRSRASISSSPPGRRTVIVGPSGAGKSTVARLLLRFLDPDTGRITVGDAELASIAGPAWRAGVAYVPQAPHLFHGTRRRQHPARPTGRADGGGRRGRPRGRRGRVHR